MIESSEHTEFSSVSEEEPEKPHSHPYQWPLEAIPTFQPGAFRQAIPSLFEAVQDLEDRASWVTRERTDQKFDPKNVTLEHLEFFQSMALRIDFWLKVAGYANKLVAETEDKYFQIIHRIQEND
jgi:hypothetical protein